MKKLFFLAATAMVAMTASALELPNQPIGLDGLYIVQWDCAAGKFATANTMEADEAFVMAFDVTGTPLADWLTATPTAAGASRGIAFNNWTGCGDTNGDFRRLKHISGNIWGCTVAFTQVAAAGVDYSSATTVGNVLGVMGQLFGFEYTATNPGAGWWMWPAGMTEGEQVYPAGQEVDKNIFVTAPYTGTKTSDEFYGSDFEEDIYGFDITGYAAPCATPATALDEVAMKAAAKKFMENGVLFVIDANGVKHNVLGAIVK